MRGRGERGGDFCEGVLGQGQSYYQRGGQANCARNQGAESRDQAFFDPYNFSKIHPIFPGT